MKGKVSDLLGIGLLLISIPIFHLSLQQPNVLIKLAGLTGSSIIMIVEAVFLWSTWVKW